MSSFVLRILPIRDWHLEQILMEENRSTGRKTCPHAPLSTANPTWTDLGLNPGVRGERPATSRLSCGTSELCSVMLLIHWFAVIQELGQWLTRVTAGLVLNRTGDTCFTVRDTRLPQLCGWSLCPSGMLRSVGAVPVLLEPQRWDRYAVPKRRLPTYLHRVTSKKSKGPRYFSLCHGDCIGPVAQPFSCPKSTRTLYSERKSIGE